jgi:hypothetical protein
MFFQNRQRQKKLPSLTNGAVRSKNTLFVKEPKIVGGGEVLLELYGRAMNLSMVGGRSSAMISHV